MRILMQDKCIISGWVTITQFKNSEQFLKLNLTIAYVISNFHVVA
mgnify:CR=1 FL=1